MASGPITAWQMDEEKVEVVIDFLFLGSKITVDDGCSHEIRRWLLLGRKAMTNKQCVHVSYEQCVDKWDITLPTKIRIVKAIGTNGHVQLWELDSKEGKMAKNRCLLTVVLEKTPKSPLDSKDIRPVNLKGNQSWILIGKTDAKAATPVFWLSDANSWLIGRVSDAGKDWGQKEKMPSEAEMTGWHHWCNGHELGQTLGDGEGQGGFMCCSPWGRRVRHDWAAEQQQQHSIM